MKNKKNIIKNIFFVSTILLILFSSFHPILAQYQNQEKIPGAEPTTEFIPYLKSIINFGFAIIGILALFMLIIGAYQYLMAAGSGNASAAKDTITSALLGLILGLCAWIILYKINPDLVNMNPITQIQGTGGNIASPSQPTPAGGGTALTSDLSKVKCETVKNYNGFMNKDLSSLYSENVKSAQDLRDALARFRTSGPNGLTQYADLIYQTCTDKDNPVPFWYMMATFAQESSMFYEYKDGEKYGCTAKNNPGCMMANGEYIKYDTPEEGIKANIANMSRLLKANPTPLGTWNAWFWPDRPDNNNENCRNAQQYLDKFSQAAKATGLSGI